MRDGLCDFLQLQPPAPRAEVGKLPQYSRPPGISRLDLCRLWGTDTTPHPGDPHAGQPAMIFLAVYMKCRIILAG